MTLFLGDRTAPSTRTPSEYFASSFTAAIVSPPGPIDPSNSPPPPPSTEDDLSGTSPWPMPSGGREVFISSLLALPPPALVEPSGLPLPISLGPVALNFAGREAPAASTLPATAAADAAAAAGAGTSAAKFEGTWTKTRALLPTLRLANRAPPADCEGKGVVVVADAAACGGETTAATHGAAESPSQRLHVRFGRRAGEQVAQTALPHARHRCGRRYRVKSARQTTQRDDAFDDIASDAAAAASASVSAVATAPAAAAAGPAAAATIRPVPWEWRRRRPQSPPTPAAEARCALCLSPLPPCSSSAVWGGVDPTDRREVEA